MSFGTYHKKADICGGSPEIGCQTTVGLSTAVIVSAFAGYMLGTFRGKANIIIFSVEGVNDKNLKSG